MAAAEVVAAVHSLRRVDRRTGRLADRVARRPAASGFHCGSGTRRRPLRRVGPNLTSTSTLPLPLQPLPLTLTLTLILALSLRLTYLPYP